MKYLRFWVYDYLLVSDKKPSWSGGEETLVKKFASMHGAAEKKPSGRSSSDFKTWGRWRESERKVVGCIEFCFSFVWLKWRRRRDKRKRVKEIGKTLEPKEKEKKRSSANLRWKIDWLIHWRSGSQFAGNEPFGFSTQFLCVFLIYNIIFPSPIEKSEQNWTETS